MTDHGIPPISWIQVLRIAMQRQAVVGNGPRRHVPAQAPQCTIARRPVRRVGLCARASATFVPAAPAHTNGAPTPAAALAPPAPAPAAPSAVLPPAAAYEAVVKMGTAKAELPAWKALWLGVLAGVYISFGGFMAVTAATMVGGACRGSMRRKVQGRC